MIPALIPMDMWSDFLGVLNAAMEPLYWAVSGIVVLAHWLFSQFMDPDSGWTWTLSIIFLTVVIRSLMIPLFVRQINSSRKMQLLGPKMRALQEKHGHDRELLAQKQMEMYREEGINPMASCFPLIVQMPIFIALFTVLSGAASGTPHGAWLRDNEALVASLQNAEILGARISDRFWPLTGFGSVQILALVLILLMTGVLFITQLQLMSKNMPPEAMEGPMAQQQKIMLYAFPVMFAIGGVSMPIGVLIYWLTSNVWTMGQQYLLIHNNPAPGTPAYLDWEDRMRRKGKDPEVVAAKRAGKLKGKARQPETTTSATGVVRQGRAESSRRGDSGKPVAAKSGSAAPRGPKEKTAAATDDATDVAEGSPEKKQVQRQQPSRQSRAKRKGRPVGQASAENTQEGIE
ncbi:membrane protein insertase YidC [Propionicicella superfundia]|uniref:membrane protein insertase YidC n=1 Tax=Propionicicella superfundia TaxID=348582 RepID=UPI00040FDD05|nr:membrane protein insertase YidC [Propionicicella superfundia]